MQDIEIHQAHFVINLLASLLFIQLLFSPVSAGRTEHNCAEPTGKKTGREKSAEKTQVRHTFHRRVQDRCPGHHTSGVCRVVVVEIAYWKTHP